MNKKLTTLLIFFSMLIASQANAQCTFRNTALSGNEKISYNLYFNWKFIWVKAGTANMNTVYSTFNGTPSFKCSLTTTTSKKVDKFFMLRDTLLVHSSRDMAPIVTLMANAQFLCVIYTQMVRFHRRRRHTTIVFSIC